MDKFKKVIIAIGVFIKGIVSKVFAVSVYDLTMQTVPMYAADPGPGPRLLKIGKITVPVILFVIGLFVIFSKKINKKVKAIVISILIILGILAWTILNYFADMF